MIELFSWIKELYNTPYAFGELSNWIKYLSNWIRELSNWTRQLTNLIREFFNTFRELSHLAFPEMN